MGNGRAGVFGSPRSEGRGQTKQLPHLSRRIPYTPPPHAAAVGEIPTGVARVADASSSHRTKASPEDGAERCGTCGGGVWHKFNPLMGVCAAGVALAPAVLATQDVVADLSFITKEELAVIAPKTPRAPALEPFQDCQRPLSDSAIGLH